MSCETDNHNFIVLSNLSYLLPMLAVIYMWSVGKLRADLAIELLILLIGVFLVSWLYHSCRYQTVKQQDPCQDSPHLVNDCIKCSKEGTNLQWVDTEITISSFSDRLLAQYVTILVITYILPLKPVVKATIRSVSLILIIILLLSGTNEYVAMIPGFVVSLFILNPITLINTSYMTTLQNVLVAILSISSLTGLALYQFPKDKYWLYHSLWHIIGAIACTISILLAGSFYDVPEDKLGSSLYHLVTDSHLLQPIKDYKTIQS